MEFYHAAQITVLCGEFYRILVQRSRVLARDFFVAVAKQVDSGSNQIRAMYKLLCHYYSILASLRHCIVTDHIDPWMSCLSIV